MSGLRDDYWTNTHAPRVIQPDSLLEIQIIDGVEPLDPKSNAWPPKSVPDAIDPILFGPQKKSDQPPLNTYAILDAAKIANLPDVLQASGLAHSCLFQGVALDDLGEVAPWVVALDPDASFTKNLFTRSDAAFHLWDAEPGIYLRSDATLADLCKHFRKFTKVKDDQGKWVFFRFWDVPTAQIYFAGIQSDPSRINPFFGLPKQQRLELIALNRAGRAVHMVGPVLDDGPMRPQMPTFDHSDKQLLGEVGYHALSVEIGNWLLIEYENKLGAVPPAKVRLVSDHIVSTGRGLGLTLKEEFAFLGQMMATSGGWFVHGGYPAGIQEICQGDPATRLQTLVDNYALLQSRTPQAEIMQRWPEVHAFLAEIPLVERITPQQFQSFCTRFLSNTASDVAAALASTRSRLSAIQLGNQRLEGVAIILTLILGPRFFEDPFQPWSQLPIEEAIDVAWTSTVG